MIKWITYFCYLNLILILTLLILIIDFLCVPWFISQCFKKYIYLSSIYLYLSIHLFEFKNKVKPFLIERRSLWLVDLTENCLYLKLLGWAKYASNMDKRNRGITIKSCVKIFYMGRCIEITIFSSFLWVYWFKQGAFYEKVVSTIKLFLESQSISWYTTQKLGLGLLTSW